jgi:hypothetical protein
MGHSVAGEITKSQASQGLETVRARQAHFIKWCYAKHIVDPVGPEGGWQFVLAIYVKYVMTGVNYLNKSSVRSATCKGYALDAARLFTLRGYPSPVDFSDPRCWTRIIVKNLEREEDIARQRKPLDASIHAEIIRFAREASKDSLEEVVSNVIAAGKFLGWRASEHSQTSQDKVDYHKYPSGKEVMKAINGNDVIYTDKKGRLIEIKKKSDLKKVHAVIITFRHQKNRQNGQQIRLLALKSHPEICPVMNLAQMSLRKIKARHSNDMPLAMFINAEKEVKYLTSQKVTEIIRKAVKSVYPDILKEDLMKYSTHSIRVWACVSLDEANKPPDFIKKRLRWMGESYRVYLRDTNTINEQHNSALEESSQAVMDLIDSDIDNQMQTLSEEDREESGEYEDGD